QQKGAAHQQADGDGENGEQADLPAPGQVDQSFAKEVAQRLEQAHGVSDSTGSASASAVSGPVAGGTSRLGGSVPGNSWSLTRRPASRVSTRRPTRWIMSRSCVASSTVVPRRL